MISSFHLATRKFRVKLETPLAKCAGFFWLAFLRDLISLILFSFALIYFSFYITYIFFQVFLKEVKNKQMSN